MTQFALRRQIPAHSQIQPPEIRPAATLTATLVATLAGQAALAAAQALAKQAAAPATLRAYRADWTHVAD